MIPFPLFISPANSFWNFKVPVNLRLRNSAPLSHPPPARCFQFTWQLLICSPNPFLLGLTRFKVTPLSSWNFEKIVHSKVIVSTVHKKRSLTYLFPVSWPLLSASLRARHPVRNWSESQGYSNRFYANDNIRISFGSPKCCCTMAIMIVKVWLCVFKIVKYLSPTIVTKRRGHRKADCNPHGKTVIGLKEEYWNSLLPQKTIHIVFSCTWKRCLRGETIGKRERVLWSTRAGQRSGANTWSWSTLLKVLEDRRSLWEIACWCVWRIGNLLRKANHVGGSMKTKDQGTRGPGC